MDEMQQISTTKQVTAYFDYKTKRNTTDEMIFRLAVKILSLPLNPVLEECEFFVSQVCYWNISVLSFLRHSSNRNAHTVLLFLYSLEACEAPHVVLFRFIHLIVGREEDL